MGAASHGHTMTKPNCRHDGQEPNAVAFPLPPIQLTSAALSTRSRMSGLAGALPPLAARAARRVRMMPMM